MDWLNFFTGFFGEYGLFKIFFFIFLLFLRLIRLKTTFWKEHRYNSKEAANRRTTKSYSRSYSFRIKTATQSYSKSSNRRTKAATKKLIKNLKLISSFHRSKNYLVIKVKKVTKKNDRHKQAKLSLFFPKINWSENCITFAISSVFWNIHFHTFK